MQLIKMIRVATGIMDAIEVSDMVKIKSQLKEFIAHYENFLTEHGSNDKVDREVITDKLKLVIAAVKADNLNDTYFFLRDDYIPYLRDVYMQLEGYVNSEVTIDDHKTNRIIEQYTDFAYPNFWKGVIPKHIRDLSLKKSTKFIGTAFGNYDFITKIAMEKSIPSSKLKILVAGCGTGESSIPVSVMHPEIDITYLDISKMSLSYAKSYVKELGLDNISFVHDNIMTLDLGETYDIIISTGVIHHLSEPEVGIKNLANHLKPHGVLLGMVYGSIARNEINMYQTMIQEVFGDDYNLDEVLAFTKRFLASIPEGSRFEKLLEYQDIQMGDQHIVDLLINVNEKSYDIQGTIDLVSKGDMKVINFLNNYSLNPENYLPNESDQFDSLSYYSRCIAGELLYSKLNKINFIAVRNDSSFDPLSNYNSIMKSKPVWGDFNEVLQVKGEDKYYITCRFDCLYETDIDQMVNKLTVTKSVLEILEKLDGTKVLDNVLKKYNLDNQSKTTIEKIVKKMVDNGMMFIK